MNKILEKNELCEHQYKLYFDVFVSEKKRLMSYRCNNRDIEMVIDYEDLSIYISDSIFNQNLMPIDKYLSYLMKYTNVEIPCPEHLSSNEFFDNIIKPCLINKRNNIHLKILNNIKNKYAIDLINNETVELNNNIYVCLSKRDAEKMAKLNYNIAFNFLTSDLVLQSVDKYQGKYIVSANGLIVLINKIKKYNNKQSYILKPSKQIVRREHIAQKTYIMYDRNTDMYKIGRSNNPEYRERTLQSEKPTIELVLICNDNIESILHKEFKELRVRGEWFKLNADDILYIIKKYKFKKA